MGEQILGDLSLRWVLYGYPILHSPPVHSKTPRQEFYRGICRGLCKICSDNRFRIWLKQNELNWDRKILSEMAPNCVYVIIGKELDNIYVYIDNGYIFHVI